MIDTGIPSSTGPTAGRVQLFVQEQGLLEGHVPLKSGQALTPFLGKCNGSLTVSHAVWVQTGRRLDQRQVRTGDILWVRALDPEVPLIQLTALVAETCPVEIVMSSGDVITGQMTVPKGHGVEDVLSAEGRFIPLWRAHSTGQSRSLGDIALNRDAIEAIRKHSGDQPASDAAGPSGRLHWLIRVAVQLQLPGVENLALAPDAPIARVWSAVTLAAGLDDAELARHLANHLKLPLAELGVADADGHEGLGATLVERYGVRVLADDGRTLTVATADPMNADAEQALAFASKRRIAFALASPAALGIVIENDPEPELESFLASMKAATESVSIENEIEAQEVEIEDASSEPIVKLANLILREAVRQEASDIHLEPDQSRGIVRFRIDGVLRPYMHVPRSALTRVISRYKVIARLDIADRVRPQDGRVRIRVAGKRYELRLSTVPTQDVEKAVLRIAGSVREQTLDHLHITTHELASIRQLLTHRDGIVIVTGPTGSGKTTTLYGALHELNSGKTNIMTVEDPVERALSGVTQIQVQPKAGVTFSSALRAILRQDPDVILLGEIRDLETAEIAVQAAMTGHLVLTTLHTTSAVGVVTRLRDLGLDGSSLAAALRGVVAQRLARRTCLDCSGAGCLSCEQSGFRGRIPLLEVLTTTSEFGELIGQGAGFHELQRAALRAGMRPMQDVAEARVRDGETTYEEVQRVLGSVEDEERFYQTSNPALPSGSAAPTTTVEPARLPAGPQPEGVSGLPARYTGGSDYGHEQLDTPARRRAAAARALIQGLDRYLAEGHGLQEAMNFACEQLAAVFESPLVWIGTLEEGTLHMRARAGASAPYVRDIVAQWDDIQNGDGAVATALRTGEPQARHLEQEPGFDSWREFARAYGLPIFLAVPMDGSNGPVGVVGLHARGMEGLDQHAGNELVTLVDRVTGAFERLRHLENVHLQLSALESATDVVFTMDRRGVIQWINRAFTELTGYVQAEAVGQMARMLRPDDHDESFYQSIWDTILTGRPWRGDVFDRRKDGGLVAVEQTVTPVTNDRGEVSYFLFVQRDISERKQREEAVQTLVNHDPATGLPNARALDVELGRAVSEAAEKGREYSLLLVHLNGSASVRDSHGHDVADKLVSAVGNVLKHTLRPGDYLARLGDDEFAALLPDTPPEGVVIAADRLCAMVNSHSFDIQELPAPPSISIGVATVDGSESSRAVLALADSALYGPRERKDIVIAVPHNEMNEEDTDAGNGWGARIKDALRDDQFFLHFQPVVRLDNGTVSHFDALIRLHDEDGDVIPARAFISHAERLGLMPQLDRWVVENVLRLLHMSPELRVSLNLSAATLTSASFRQFLQRQSRNLSTVSSRIIFEVGEIAAAQNLARAVDSMTRLTHLGCRFAIDNFGITAASLASLGALPVDYVKLDGSLIRSIDVDESARELVQALTTIARALGKEVIAGWAERAPIVALLPELGIGLAQGHHLGRPSRELRAAVGERIASGEDASARTGPVLNGRGASDNGKHRARIAV